MVNKIKALITKVLMKIWKKPLPAINNGSIVYLADIKDTYYMYIREVNNNKSEYCINLIMLATLEYLCKVVLNNPDVMWPARYDFLVNLHSNTRVYAIAEKGPYKDKREYLEKRPGIFMTSFGPLNLVCSYNESKRLDKDNQTIEVLIIDKWPAVFKHITGILKKLCYWAIIFSFIILTAVLLIEHLGV